MAKLKKIFNLYIKFYEQIKMKLLYFYNEYKSSFITIFLSGILVHLFALTNKLLNWDELEFIFGKGWSVELGRWLLGVTCYFFPNYSMPTFNGIIAIIFITLSSIFISEILEIKSKFNRYLIGMILISFPTFTSSMTYMYAVHSYMLAVFFAVLAVYFAKSDKKLYYVFAVILLIGSIAIYQAYISISATLLVILLIKQNLKCENYKTVLKTAIKYLLILMISALMYFLLNKLYISISGRILYSYQGVNEMGNYSISGIMNGFINAFKHIIEPFKSTTLTVIDKTTRIIYIISFLFCTSCLIYKTIKIKDNIVNMLLSFLFIATLPLAINSMYILNENLNVHTLILYADVFVFIGVVVIIDTIKNEKLKYFDWLVKFILVILIYSNIFLANQAYLEMHLAYENVYAYYSEMVGKIKSLDGYNENLKIAIIGNTSSEKMNNMIEFQNVDYITGVASNIELVNSAARNSFIKYYIGLNGVFIDKNTLMKYLEQNDKQNEIDQMPNYPNKESIKLIDDIIVVKLSN